MTRRNDRTISKCNTTDCARPCEPCSTDTQHAAERTIDDQRTIFNRGCAGEVGTITRKHRAAAAHLAHRARSGNIGIELIIRVCMIEDKRSRADTERD